MNVRYNMYMNINRVHLVNVPVHSQWLILRKHKSTSHGICVFSIPCAFYLCRVHFHIESASIANTAILHGWKFARKIRERISRCIHKEQSQRPCDLLFVSLAVLFHSAL